MIQDSEHIIYNTACTAAVPVAGGAVLLPVGPSCTTGLEKNATGRGNLPAGLKKSATGRVKVLQETKKCNRDTPLCNRGSAAAQLHRVVNNKNDECRLTNNDLRFNETNKLAVQNTDCFPRPEFPGGVAMTRWCGIDARFARATAGRPFPLTGLSFRGGTTMESKCRMMNNDLRFKNSNKKQNKLAAHSSQLVADTIKEQKTYPKSLHVREVRTVANTIKQSSAYET